MTPSRILAGIFLFSFSSLGYEIALTRILSISLWYHFAFMVISIAMLGIGASGTALSVYPRLKAISRIGLYGLFLGETIMLSYIIANRIPFDPVRLSWDRVQILYIFLYYVLLSSPFFFFGLCISTAFSAISESSGLLYGSDLLGAGIGSICLLLFMEIMGPEHAVVLLSSVALTGAFISGGSKIKILSLVLIALNAVLLVAPDVSGLISPRMSPYKGLQSAFKYPGAEHIRTYNNPLSRIDVFKSPAARFAPGLSLKYLEALPEQIGISIDGGDMNAITYNGSDKSLGFLEYMPSALPYILGNKNDVLILEPKGGLEVMLAQHYASGNIYKVDSNPFLIKIIRDNFRKFSRALYDRNTWSGLGRSWLKKRIDRFDIIDIPHMGTSPSGSFGIAEDYRFTVEAFKGYLGHLKENGILSIHLFILPPPRIELRLLGTLIAAMEEIGVKNTGNKIIAIRSWGTICILTKAKPFTVEEIDSARKFATERRFDFIYFPGIREEETNLFVKMPSNEYFFAFSAIINPETRKSFQSDYLFDIRPVRDENPFFHYYLKLKNIKRIYEVMGKKWQYFIEEGYLLPAIFIQILLLSIALIFLPAFSKKSPDVVIARNNVTKQSKSEISPDDKIASAKPRNDRTRISLLYFGLLGLGFMFVEISLIQKMILPLENPFYAVAVVLSTILVSSGTGSLLSYRFSILKGARILHVIALLVAAYSFLLPLISDIIAPYPIAYKIVFSFFLLAPLAILMGIPFPVGMKNLGETSPDSIPWAWAVNGCLSVIAPILAIMLAMAIGFKAVLWIGAGAYLFAYFTFPKTQKTKIMNSQSKG